MILNKENFFTNLYLKPVLSNRFATEKSTKSGGILTSTPHKFAENQPKQADSLSKTLKQPQFVLKMFDQYQKFVTPKITEQSDSKKNKKQPKIKQKLKQFKQIENDSVLSFSSAIELESQGEKLRCQISPEVQWDLDVSSAIQITNKCIKIVRETKNKQLPHDLFTKLQDLLMLLEYRIAPKNTSNFGHLTERLKPPVYPIKRHSILQKSTSGLPQIYYEKCLPQTRSVTQMKQVLSEQSVEEYKSVGSETPSKKQRRDRAMRQSTKRE